MRGPGPEAARPGRAVSEGAGAPGDGGAAEPALLEVRGLRTWFEGREGTARAVDGVSFRLDRGETLALVGESGCGKTLTALSILRLVPEPGRIRPGSSVRLRGEELLEASPGRMREVRGGEIAMVFQEPTRSLNPVLPVGEQVEEAVRRHREPGRDEARREAIRLLGRVGIPEPEDMYGSYPHQLSGGLRQRAMIAMALGGGPSVLVADEPTTALDVTIQAQILELLASLRDELGMAILLITHDLALVAESADRVAVMYAGRIVEEASAEDLFGDPRHPYTVGLMGAVPDPERTTGFEAIPGAVPHPARWPAGCRFHPRCPHAWERCEDEPPLLEDGSSRSRCWLAEEPGRRRAAGRDDGGAR